MSCPECNEAREERDIARAEAARWAARLKLLEDRERRAILVLEGRADKEKVK